MADDQSARGPDVELSPSYTMRRAQFWLGTLVDIAAAGPSPPACEAAIRDAFTAIARVHDALSAYEADSELSRVNRSAHRSRQSISNDLRTVLSCALDVARHSNGVFDPTVGACLVALGFLPAYGLAARRRARSVSHASWCDIDLDADGVRHLKPLVLNFDGIAKGYAVDCAIDALRAHGMTAGRVNAGGDLRVFGAGPESIHVRAGGPQTTLLPLVAIADGAVATSAYGNQRRRIDGRWVTPLIDPRRRLPLMSTRTVSVIAPTCIVADALTKVLMLRGRGGARILAHYNAAGCIFSPVGDRWRWTRLPATTPATMGNARADPAGPPTPNADQPWRISTAGARSQLSLQGQR